MTAPARRRIGPAVLAVVTAALVLLVPAGLAARPESAQELAGELRCPSCAGTSVADSPSPIARQIRTRIAAELRAGRTPDQVRRELTASYGDWIVLAPPRRGWSLLPWLVPSLAAGSGVAVVVALARRWTVREEP